MKILVLALARLGDSYMAWPALRALRRKHPDAKISVMVRPRFAEAMNGLEVIDQIIELPVKDIMAPILEVNSDLDGSVTQIQKFIDSIRRENFDWIINLTFSPSSSTLVQLMAKSTTQLSGYSRFSDGSLNLTDEISAYFYAQVGTDSWNRYHMAHIFAEVVGEALIDSDWSGPNNLEVTEKFKNSIIIHIGASEQHKTMTVPQWSALVSALMKTQGLPIVLIGSKEEVFISEEILKTNSSSQVINLVGKTTLSELFSLLANARLLIGGDSAPMHMCSLVNTPCVNISVGRVNFWETGPLARGSVIVTDDRVEQVVSAVESVLGQKNYSELIYTVPGTVAYHMNCDPKEEFAWGLILALYTGADFPMVDFRDTADSLVQLWEMNRVIIDQLKKIEQGASLETMAPILNRGDEIISLIGKLRPEVSPIVSWYQSLKVKIPPGDSQQVLKATQSCHDQLQAVLNLYCGSSEIKTLDGDFL